MKSLILSVSLALSAPLLAAAPLAAQAQQAAATPGQQVVATGGRVLNVTATGERAEEGFDWKNPNPFASSAGMRLRRDTSLTRTKRRIAAAAWSREAPMGTSSTMAATSASKSIPSASSAAGIGSRGPRNESEPP